MNPNYKLMERFGWCTDGKFFWWKDFSTNKKGNTITMYIYMHHVKTLSEFELYKIIKDKEQRAKRYLCAN